MKRKILIIISFFAVVILCKSCCWLFPASCEDPEFTYEDAIATIGIFKDDLVNSTNAVVLKSSKSARPGEVWIYDDCMETIQLYSATPIDDFHGGDYSLLVDPLTSRTYEFHWENSWTNSHSIDVDVQYELLELVIKASAENSKVSSLDFKISFKSPQYIRVKNISGLLDEYEAHLRSNKLKADGNIIISAVIKGNLYVEFKAYNESKQQIEINLSADLNKLIEELPINPGYKYFVERGSSGGYTIIEESEESPTAFAIEYFEIASDLQESNISNIIYGYCGSSGISSNYIDLEGYCYSSNQHIADLRIEKGASANTLYLFWTNRLNQTIDLLKGTLTARNRSGQIVKSFPLVVIGTIDPGMTIQDNAPIFSTSPNGQSFTLEEVDFDLVITAASYRTNIICK